MNKLEMNKLETTSTEVKL